MQESVRSVKDSAEKCVDNYLPQPFSGGISESYDWWLYSVIVKGGPIPLYPNTFDTKYRVKHFTYTDSNTDTNVCIWTYGGYRRSFPAI